MAVVYSKVLLFDPPLIYTAPDTCVFGAVRMFRNKTCKKKKCLPLAASELLQSHFYEATTNPTYGCGFMLSQCDQIYKENITAGNQLGLELEQTRDYFRGQEAQDGGAN